ncbi:MAG: hypothetical protein KAI79_19130 [Bacteroidales bacterium]|nr:hypothetical protein [Bacteroidales bacterium]
MKSIILYIASIITLSTLLISCGEESKLAKEETFYINENNLQWNTSDNINDVFIVKDDNGISSSFTKWTDNHEFSPSWSSFMGITTSITNTESYTQSYKNNVDFYIDYMTILTAGWPPYGDYLSLSFGNISVHYDFKEQVISNFYSDWGYKSYLMTDKGYEKVEIIFSSVEFLENYEVNEQVFEQIMHFKFADFSEFYTDFTVTNVYLAPEIGLVQYSLKNGLNYKRVF